MITCSACFRLFSVIFQGLLSPLVPGSLKHLSFLLTDAGWVIDYNTQDTLLFVQPILSTPCDNGHREATVVPNVSAVVFKRLLTVFFCPFEILSWNFHIRYKEFCTLHSERPSGEKLDDFSYSQPTVAVSEGRPTWNLKSTACCGQNEMPQEWAKWHEETCTASDYNPTHKQYGDIVIKFR